MDSLILQPQAQGTSVQISGPFSLPSFWLWYSVPPTPVSLGPNILFLPPQPSETAVINFQEVPPLPALCHAKCFLEEEFPSFVWFSSLVGHSPGFPIVPVSENRMNVLQSFSCLWWKGMITSAYFIMAKVEQFLFLIQVFILAVLILNKCDLRLFIFVVFWVIRFSSRALPCPPFFKWNSTWDYDIENS